ncbi:hypothetical protein [Permianibacter aggregans]|uniref:Uncharacterized protein n=1 Tax=Permianibacter aggregans TaxID=1510150 RepID=A0A4R6UVQ3_9GAMM|nr:hypothetical protein [Permianibacter aggregans]QGX39336.1 hypothetical protein E2H98_06555 [Permianibacter aggregans]QGX39344.1 hypothetical protein E2H98_06600 [Permianibacter aggregans]TDQ49923.1 hypothetical protein EV696_103298 [Permianibacter aggregans]
MGDINIGSINSGRNNITQNNITNTTISRSSSSTSRRSANPLDDGLALVLIAAVLLGVTAYIYLRHYHEIFFYLQVLAISAMFAPGLAITPNLYGQGLGIRSLMLAIVGMLLGAAQVWIVVSIKNGLPAEILDIANEPPRSEFFLAAAKEVWLRFNSHAHNLILDNLFSTTLVSIASFFLILYALWLCADSAFRINSSRVIFAKLAKLMHFTYPFGIIFCAALTAAAWAASMGYFTPHLQ